MRRHRLLDAAGVAGPAAFVGAWVIGSAIERGYSPIDEPISRLAQLGASTRPLMTTGLVAFGLTAPAFAWGARRQLGTPSAVALTLAGLGTLGIAATPLHPTDAVPAHAVAAAIAYAGFAATPVLSKVDRNLPLGVVAAASLVASTVGPAQGLLQRLGLTLVDVWVVRRALSDRGASS